MTNLEISVNVNLGVSQELMTLATKLLNKIFTETPIPQDDVVPVEKTKRKDNPVKNKPATKSAATVETTSEDSGPTTSEENKKEYTEEDVRVAMHRTRARIEGEDYKENTSSELYTLFHKQLTSNFKNISAELGSDKPSSLPADKRADFILRCDNLIIGDDGNLTTQLPF